MLKLINLEIQNIAKTEKEQKKTTKKNSIPWNEAISVKRIELCMREIILHFEMNLWNSLVFWQFTSSCLYFQASTLCTEVLCYWAKETVHYPYTCIICDLHQLRANNLAIYQMGFENKEEEHLLTPISWI
jgi:hypothetical protein